MSRTKRERSKKGVIVLHTVTQQLATCDLTRPREHLRVAMSASNFLTHAVSLYQEKGSKQLVNGDGCSSSLQIAVACDFASSFCVANLTCCEPLTEEESTELISLFAKEGEALQRKENVFLLLYPALISSPLKNCQHEKGQQEQLRCFCSAGSLGQVYEPD